MSAARFMIRSDTAQTWSVIELTTGRCASLDGEEVCGLTIEKAVEAADFLEAAETCAASDKAADRAAPAPNG